LEKPQALEEKRHTGVGAAQSYRAAEPWCRTM